MTDQDAWKRGIRIISNLYDQLPLQTRQQLGALLGSYRQHKEEMLALTLTAGSKEICRDCGGQCCLNGKYRISGLDLLTHLGGQSALPSPDFAGKPLCPYGDSSGCSMEPGLRPLDCVLFICDALEQRLEDAASATLATREQELRGIVKDVEALLGKPLGQPLLLLAKHPGCDC